MRRRLMCKVPLRKGKTKRLIRAVEAADAQAAVRVQAKYMNKQPKFFCENCNAEVRRDAVICPHCGRFFASVRCPSCGFTGTHKEFKDGCPSCGYAFTPDQQENKKDNTKKRKKRNSVLCNTSDMKPMPAPTPTPYLYGYTG
ncbi:zinc ribbon domain-containing protein [Treponema sp. OMZ 838]|uniref:double zinc ribbon domain-containing protein n=1 Tax=Treponema sp. OMZ 838 TaxID=1539298 RepID=UPI003510BDB9